MIWALSIVLVMAAGFLMMNPITTFLHELGHAIPCLILTRKPVTVFIGTYGDPTQGISFKIGSLKVHFKFNLLGWTVGLCVPEQEVTSLKSRILITLGGPLASTLIAIPALLTAFLFDMHGVAKLAVLLFVLSALLDLFFNLIPSIRFVSGRQSLIYSDGEILRQLFRDRRWWREYYKAEKQHAEGNIAGAAPIYLSLLERGWNDANLCLTAINCYAYLGDTERVVLLYRKLSSLRAMTPEELQNHAFHLNLLGRNHEASEIYKRLIASGDATEATFNNLGYSYLHQGDHEEALHFLNLGLAEFPASSLLLANRGLALSRLGRTEEGSADIETAIRLDPNEPYALLNLGIMHLERGEAREALRLFEELRLSGKWAHNLNEWTTKAQQQLEQ